MKKLDGPDFWRSLEEYAETPEFSEMLGREFPRHASEWDGDDDGVSRRRFLELSGASLALAGLSGCVKQPREGLVPYVKQPEELVPGRPLFFATGFTLSGYATGILVESNTGRPTKVEGNPQHPASLGATDVFAQASILSIYDPDRSQTITKLGQIRTWPVFTEELQARVKTSRALGGEALLSGSLAARLVEEFRGRGRRRRLLAAHRPGTELTRREWQVLELLAEHLTPMEIAARLFVEPVTVRTHVAAVLRKLQVPNRQAALRLLEREDHQKFPW